MRRGASMPELLVAMLVLLLGIWVVAAKFPQLAEIMTREKTRDQMARKAEQQVERSKDNVALLPTMVAPYDASLVKPLDPLTPVTNPYGIRDTLAASTDPPLSFYDPSREPDWTDPARPLNCAENTLLVIGETFHLPAPPVVHFLQEGPAEKVWRVYQPIPLTRDDARDPFSRDVTPYPGSFYLRDDGVIRFSLPERDPDGHPFTPSIPTNAAQIEVNYAWVDTANHVHQMTGEIVDCTLDTGQTVNWTNADLDGDTKPDPVSVVAENGKVVPNSATATFRYDYEVVASNGARTTTQPPAYYDANYGHLLSFDPSEQGKTLCADYRLRTYRNAKDPTDTTDPDYGRRIPLAREIHRVPDDPVASVVEVALDFQQLDDQIPVFTADLDDNALAPQPHVIAFDLEDMSRVYSDVGTGDGLLNVSYVASGGTTATVPGWMEGRVSFPGTSPAKGSTLLFYYRNLDRQTVQLQRAPATFTEDIWGSATTRPYWAIGRWYRPERDGASDATSPVLLFPDSCLTHTVRVEYVWNGRRTVEIHTLGEQSPATITLDAGPDASVEIRSVTGVSVKGFATWLGRGKLRAMGVETLLPAQLEPTLARDPLQGALQP